MSTYTRSHAAFASVPGSILAVQDQLIAQLMTAGGSDEVTDRDMMRLLPIAEDKRGFLIRVEARYRALRQLPKEGE